jgi:hypothetical protein
MHISLTILASILFCLLLSAEALAQPAASASLSGGFGVYYDMYRYSASKYPGFRPRMPDNLGRITADATLSIGTYFRIPFSANLSTQDQSFNYPSLPDEGIRNYISNPRNNISVNPSYKWFESFLGTQTPNYSKLSTGDIALFGVGLNMKPGKFLFSMNYGKSQAGVSYDPLQNIEGAYAQHLFATRIGVGTDDGSKFVINLVKSTDDPNSVSVPLPDKRPSETMTIGPAIQLKLGSKLFLNTETAASLRTFDVFGPELDDNTIADKLSFLLPINASTYADYSNISSIEWRNNTFGIGAEIQYIGAGFEPAGFRTFERDLMDYTIKTNMNLAQSKVMIDGTVGIRSNNISNTKLDKTNRTIANMNVFAMLSNALSVNANYSNFGFRNNLNLDTLRVEMINNTFALSPTFQMQRSSGTHILTLNGSLDAFDDFNPLTGKWQNTSSRSLGSNYQYVHRQKPFSAGLQFLTLQNKTPFTEISVANIGANMRYRLLDKKLSPSLTLTHSNINRSGYTADRRFLASLKADYRIHPKWNVNLWYNFNQYRYGSSRPDAVTAESKIQAAIVTRF